MTAFFAVRIVVSFEECFRAQLLFAVIADKVFGVIGVTHGGHHLAHDHFVTSAAMAFRRRIHALLSGLLA